ncbi:MAG: SUF system NifU family Fe-S cluster assembly protein [Proteobacteria bacterium]|nr:SUF system NifU family Fe-S cluster assembly protein [Pseudomonadota bacterium]
MTDDLRELYQEVILEHGRHPRNFGPLDHPTHAAHGHNPLCGDQIDVFVTVDEAGVIRDVSFRGRGCAISVASASLMTEVLRGKTEAEARALFESFQGMCTGREEGGMGASEEDVERLRPLSGVRQFPVRVKCATLAWHTLKAAIEGRGEVSTEEDEDAAGAPAPTPGQSHDE